jgi:hypothetical protein
MDLGHQCLRPVQLLEGLKDCSLSAESQLKSVTVTLQLWNPGSRRHRSVPCSHRRGRCIYVDLHVLLIAAPQGVRVSENKLPLQNQHAPLRLAWHRETVDLKRKGTAVMQSHNLEGCVNVRMIRERVSGRMY